MLSDARAEATAPVMRLDRAREFYEGVLGLLPIEEHTPGVDVTYGCAGGTRLMLYEWAATMTRSQHCPTSSSRTSRRRSRNCEHAACGSTNSTLPRLR